MGFNRFKLYLILRVIFLTISLFILCYSFLFLNYNMVGIFFILLSIFQVYSLIHYVDKTNRDLTRFFNSIKFSDFSETFSAKNYGNSFNELHGSFKNVMEQFRNTRSEMEENFQYLQTVVKHVKIGLISFSSSGEISLINNAAKELLNVQEIKNLNQLKSVSTNLVDLLIDITPGKKHLLKINMQNHPLQLSIFAAEFKMRGKKFILVSLQDIYSELEHERLSSELEIARKVQFDLLPKKTPEIPGYSISARCIPAREVGGDYYDFIKISEDKIGIVIADVAGKGLPASIYMTLTKGVFQSYALHIESPKEVLVRLNSLIYDDIKRGTFVTMFYAVLDFNNNTLTFCRAGHEPVIFFNNEKIKKLQPKGIGLGLDSGKLFSSSIEEEKIIINPGDSFLFYTDGVTDSGNNENNRFGSENFIKKVEEFKNLKPDDLLNSLIKEINVFTNHQSQYDDITFVAVRKC